MLNLILNAIDFGLSPDKAVTEPRFCTFHHQNSFEPNPDRSQTFLNAGALEISSAIDESIRNDLSGRGHPLEVKDGPISTPVMLKIEDGKILAAGDPEAKRHAAGL